MGLKIRTEHPTVPGQSQDFKLEIGKMSIEQDNVELNQPGASIIWSDRINYSGNTYPGVPGGPPNAWYAYTEGDLTAFTIDDAIGMQSFKLDQSGNTVIGGDGTLTVTALAGGGTQFMTVDDTGAVGQTSGGADGTSGSSGTSGVDGTSGSSGTSGVDGTSGSSGTSGVDGTSGSSGISGTDGTSGTSGVDGTSGSSGTSGVDGTSGSSGTSGTDGASGTDGSSGSSGTSGTDGVGGNPGGEYLTDNTYRCMPLQANFNGTALTAQTYQEYGPTVAGGLYLVDTAADKNNHYGIAMGQFVPTAVGKGSLKIGESPQATGSYSVAIGDQSVASGNYSFAHGANNTASATASAVFGRYTTASAGYAFAQGTFSAAKNEDAAAFGSYTETGSAHQMVVGTYNEVKSSPLFIVGAGTGATYKINSLEVLQNGDVNLRDKYDDTYHSLSISGATLQVDGTPFAGGTSGSSGTSGVDGTSGSSGTSGVDGTSGSSGTSGVDGTSGTDGGVGTSGSSGTSGVDGTSGSSGTSGTDGQSVTGVTSYSDFFYDTNAVYVTNTQIADPNYQTPALHADYVYASKGLYVDSDENGSNAYLWFRASGDTNANNALWAIWTDEGTPANNTLIMGDQPSTSPRITFTEDTDDITILATTTNITNALSVGGAISTEGGLTVNQTVFYTADLLATLNYLSANTYEKCIDDTLIICTEEQQISNTIVINFPYKITIEGIAYDRTPFVAVSGLENKPMFKLETDASFAKIMFLGNRDITYGANVNEDCIQILTDGIYCEVKDFLIDGFYRGIYQTSDAEIWTMEGGYVNCTKAGYELNTSKSGATFRSTLNDWSASVSYPLYTGINLLSGHSMYISTQEDTTNLTHSAQTFIKKPGTGAISYTEFVVSGTIWNSIGAFKSGFDFTLQRDADIVMNAVGIESMSPHAKLGWEANTGVTTTSVQNVWYKMSLTSTPNAINYLKKFASSGNKITYYPTHTKSLMMWVSGSLVPDNNTATAWQVAVVRNGLTGTTFGKIQVTTDANGRAFNFSTNIYLDDAYVNKDDYYEIWIRNTSNNTVTIRANDIQWLIDSR